MWSCRWQQRCLLPVRLGEASAGGLTACARAAKAFQNGAEAHLEGWKPEAETRCLAAGCIARNPTTLAKAPLAAVVARRSRPSRSALLLRSYSSRKISTTSRSVATVRLRSTTPLGRATLRCSRGVCSHHPWRYQVPRVTSVDNGSYGQPSQPKHVLLQVDVAGRPPQYVRHPGSLPALRTRLARLLRFGENSLRVSAEVSVSQEKLPPTQERPRVMAIRATGRPLAGAFDALFLCMAWLNLGTAIAFCAIELSQAPFPFHYLVVLPALPFYFNVSSVSTAIRGEYLINKNLRDVLGRKSIELWLLLVLSFAGCDTTLMLAATTLLPRGVKLSDECSNALRANAAVIAPLTLDLPLLLVNYLWHKRTGARTTCSRSSCSLCRPSPSSSTRPTASRAY